MTFDQFIATANIIEHFVVTDEKASDLLNEALGYQRRANSFNDLENEEAKQFNGYYRDTMQRCANRVAHLTGVDKRTIHRVLVPFVIDML